MSGGKKKNPGVLETLPGLGDRYAEAAGTPKITHGANCAKPNGFYEIHPEDGGEPFYIEAKGRDAWALNCLIDAGLRGCTPIEQPAPRWSAYVHRLRSLGVPIDTQHEPHGGAFAGTHGRYILRAHVVKGCAA